MCPVDNDRDRNHGDAGERVTQGLAARLQQVGVERVVRAPAARVCLGPEELDRGDVRRVPPVLALARHVSDPMDAEPSVVGGGAEGAA